MADQLIKSVNPPPRVRDALRKPEADKRRKPKPGRRPQSKKDPKRIIDTYA